MLSAFTARPIVELQPKEKAKIESLLSYGDRLLVGLSTGALRIYRINELNSGLLADRPASQPLPEAVELAEEHTGFAKYKVEQLAVIKEAGALIALSNAQVSIYDLASYELQDSLVKSKGASTFAVTSNIVQDEDTGVPFIVSRLAIAVKRKLLLWSWHDSELVDENPELTLVTGIRSLTWVTGTRLIAGLTASYVLIDVESREVTDIVGPGSIGGTSTQDAGRFSAGIGYMGMGGIAPKPLATKLSEGEVLLAKDVNTHFIDTEGNSLNRRQIPWSAAPDAIGYSYPFMLSLQATKGTLEVRNPETLGALQTISLPHATMLQVPNPYVRLAHAGKGFLVSSEKCVWRMEALGYDAQIASLIESKRYDEAISLLNLLEDALLSDKEGNLRESKFLKAQGLFDNRKYRDAFDLFTEALAPPASVITMFPEEISGELTNVDQTAGSFLVRQSTEGSQSDNNDGVRQSSVDNSLVVPDKSDTISVFSVSTSAKGKLEGKELKSATIALQGYLVDARTKLKRFLQEDGSLKNGTEDSQEHRDEAEKFMLLTEADNNRTFHERLLATARLVDTTLFRAYMLAQPSLAGALFRLPNFCDPLVVREKLAESHRYVDLIDFLYGKQLHREALELLRDLGRKDHQDAIPEQLRGPQRTAIYLQNMGPEHVDLVLEFAEWPLREDPTLGMEIFVTDSANAENLPRQKVLAFLEKVDPSLEMQYLEYIIKELNDVTPEFHQTLINKYMGGIQKAKQEKDEGKKEELKEKLVAFLRSSSHFEPWRLLKALPKDDLDFHEARAITLGNLGQHRQALSIYVFDMGEPGKAEDYCNQVYVTEAAAIDAETDNHALPKLPSDTDFSIYQDLLSLYLSPPSPHAPQWEPALEILAKHGPRLPASSALNLIPDILPVQKLQQYFTARMRAANTAVTEARVVAGLRKTVDIEGETRLRLGGTKNGGRNRNVLIAEERVCGVCHKRFGGSAIKVLPNNAAVHYGCSAR